MTETNTTIIKHFLKKTADVYAEVPFMLNIIILRHTLKGAYNIFVNSAC